MENCVRLTELDAGDNLGITSTYVKERRWPVPARDTRSRYGWRSAPRYSATTELASAVADTGAAVTALDIVESRHDGIVVDVTCNTTGEKHAQEIADALNARDGVTVRKVSDRTFLLHLGGKLSVEPKVQLRNRDDLSRAYTPGVARVCLAIAANPEDARRLTIKRNTVAVVTDGTAVLGLGDIGPAAALPVMEGKAALFKQFGGVDAWPVCLDTKDTEEIISIVKAMAPVYGGVNLEDIAAPRCFEIERRLRDELDIPVFHDDQHGTAIVVLAALINALRVVDKKIADVRIVDLRRRGRRPRDHPAAAGPGGRPHRRLFSHRAPSTAARPTPTSTGSGSRRTPTPTGFSGSLHEALVGADVFIGVSAPNLITADDVAEDGLRTRSCWPWPTPIRRSIPPRRPSTPRSWPPVAATFPTRSTTCWPSPGCSAACSTRRPAEITNAMLVAAAEAIANCVSADELNASYIVPSVFDARVAPAVAAAVEATASRDA